ncbi:hypothetical protein J6590_018280 [Homalodisca vitripennis]|nr:hypothetical protein J6590_018280 [Homalodisca vitripennis]
MVAFRPTDINTSNYVSGDVIIHKPPPSWIQRTTSIPLIFSRGDLWLPLTNHCAAQYGYDIFLARAPKLMEFFLGISRGTYALGYEAFIPLYQDVISRFITQTDRQTNRELMRWIMKSSGPLHQDLSHIRTGNGTILGRTIRVLDDDASSHNPAKTWEQTHHTGHCVWEFPSITSALLMQAGRPKELLEVLLERDLQTGSPAYCKSQARRLSTRLQSASPSLLAGYTEHLWQPRIYSTIIRQREGALTAFIHDTFIALWMQAVGKGSKVDQQTCSFFESFELTRISVRIFMTSDSVGYEFLCKKAEEITNERRSPMVSQHLLSGLRMKHVNARACLLVLATIPECGRRAGTSAVHRKTSVSCQNTCNNSLHESEFGHCHRFDSWNLDLTSVWKNPARPKEGFFFSKPSGQEVRTLYIVAM